MEKKQKLTRVLDFHNHGFGKISKADSVFAVDKQISQQVPKVKNNFASTSQTHSVLKGGVQKKFLFWVNQWFYLVSLVQKIGDPSGAHQFLAFLPIFMAKNCPKKP